MPVMLVTGVSTGIGNALARRVAAERGWTVIGTVRSPGDPAAFGLSAEVVLMPLDLGDPESVRELVKRVLSERGTPDVIVNNAGFVRYGPIEEEPAERIEEIFRVNVFSAVALITGFLPAMRERGSGLIVNVTSLGGRLVFPFFATYNATKHALEAYSEGLWHELKPFGVRVKAIEPGYVETPIYKAMDERAEPTGPYARAVSAMNAFSDSITKRTSPEGAAEEIWAAITDTSDRLRYPVAAYARPLLAARRIFGDLAFMRFMHKRWMGE